MTSPTTTTPASGAARRQLAGSDLVRRGGFAVLPLLDAAWVDALLAEALACHPNAEQQRTGVPDDEDTAHGNPARWLEMGPGGPLLGEVYRGDALAEALRRLTGLTWEPSGGGGNYSYYRSAGHYLDVHRDADWCDLAVIVAIHESGHDPAGEAGVLDLYPARAREPVSQIRATPHERRVSLRPAPGQAVVLLGSLVPHRLVAVGEGHLRVVAPLCFTSPTV